MDVDESGLKSQKIILLGVDGSHVPIFEGTIANLDATGTVCLLNSSSGGFIEW